MEQQGWCFQCGRREHKNMIAHTYDCKYSIMERKIAEQDLELEMINASYSGLQYEMEKALKEKDKQIEILRAEGKVDAT